MEEFLAQTLPIKKFVVTQLFQWVYQKNETEVQNWTNVSHKLRGEIHELFDFSLPEIIWKGVSKDGTIKYLLKFRDGQSVESVIILSGDRVTLCLSSQVGCAVGCKFCHTGTQGFKRHLSAGEIVGQLMKVQEDLKNHQIMRVTNIVYMGQGEPLHNFESVKSATKIFLSPLAFGLSQRKVTLSTSGLVPQIEKLHEFPPVNIAISLHAARNDLRSEIMPINRAHDLTRLLSSIKKIPLKSYRHITFEYILLDGVNNSLIDLMALNELLPKDKAKINLIPFNEYPTSQFKRPSDENIRWFHHELCSMGFICTVRQTKGQDILAACGQLKSEKEKVNVWV